MPCTDFFFFLLCVFSNVNIFIIFQNLNTSEFIKLYNLKSRLVCFKIENNKLSYVRSTPIYRYTHICITYMYVPICQNTYIFHNIVSYVDEIQNQLLHFFCWHKHWLGVILKKLFGTLPRPLSQFQMIYVFMTVTVASRDTFGDINVSLSWFGLANYKLIRSL